MRTTQLFGAARSTVKQAKCYTPILSIRRFATAIDHPVALISGPDPNDSLYSYTSGRWLFNESQQMAQRYTKFNVDALHQVVANVCGAHPIHIEKKEGVFNKSFILTLTSGAKVIARIKNPIAGPKHLTTASEVATMDFARNVLGLPVPRVLAWNSKAESNPVAAEYIIMEEAFGTQLSTVWPDMSPRQKKDVVNSLISVERKLLAVRFAQYGSLYYKDDIDSPLQSPHLYANPKLESSATARFCIGPTASRSFYEDERAGLELDRGPWTSCEDYLRAIASREEAWIGRYAKPHMHDDPFRNVAGPQSQQEHLDVLQQYRAIIPALVPKDPKVLGSILWHSDLNPGNIFVNERGEVTSLIDWQGAEAMPAYLQMAVPSALEYTGKDALPSGPQMPRLPENFEDLSLFSRAVVQKQHRAKLLHKLYEIKQLLPFEVDHKDIRVLPGRTAGRTWKDGILPMKLALLNVAAQWPSLSDEPCPIRFKREEVEKLSNQRERYIEWHSFLDDVRRSLGMRLYGWVPSHEYHTKRNLLTNIRKSLPASLTEEMEAVFPKEWWPFKDTI